MSCFLVGFGWGGSVWRLGTVAGVNISIVLILAVLIGEGIVVFFFRTSVEVALDVVHFLLQESKN